MNTDATLMEPVRAQHDLRVELRARNNVLWHAIFDLYPSVQAFLRAHPVGEATMVGGFLNLTRTPYATRGGLNRTAERLCEVTGLGMEELFPPRLYASVRLRGGRPLKFVAEMSSERFVGLTAARRVALPATQEADAVADECRVAVAAVLDTLTPREARIVRLLYGLDGEAEHTQQEVARVFGCSRERIRQIEAKAFRKLRHPSRGRKLSPWLDLEYRDELDAEAAAETDTTGDPRPPVSDPPPLAEPLPIADADAIQWWYTVCAVRVEDLRSGAWAVTDAPSPPEAVDVAIRYVKVPSYYDLGPDRVGIIVWGTARRMTP